MHCRLKSPPCTSTSRPARPESWFLVNVHTRSKSSITKDADRARAVASSADDCSESQESPIETPATGSQFSSDRRTMSAPLMVDNQSIATGGAFAERPNRSAPQLRAQIPKCRWFYRWTIVLRQFGTPTPPQLSAWRRTWRRQLDGSATGGGPGGGQAMPDGDTATARRLEPLHP